MTDITELAQREKFEAWAEERCALPWGYLKNRRTNTGYYSKHDYTSLWAAWKAAGAELVEALEKAQTENTAGVAGMAESYETTISMLKSRIAELEESNAQVIQSRDHYKRMTEEGLKQLAESRTVKLPDDNAAESESPEDDAVAWFDEGWNARGKADKEALASAGIKVEAE